MQPKTFLTTALAIASIRRGPSSRAKQVWVFRFRLLSLPQSHAAVRIITVYVNDLKVIGKGIERIGALKADLMGEFQMSGPGPISYYLGIKVERDRAARKITLRDTY